MYYNAVKITEFNDYLNPSEECVLPLTKKEEKYEIKTNDRRSELNGRKNKVNLKNDGIKEDIYKENKLKVTNKDKNNRITVGLSDCLSCSGCLTSSEEILLKEDNKEKVVNKMRESKSCVVSISPQTIFMFSSYYDVSPEKAMRKLSYLFRRLGAKLVFNIGLAELITLHQSKEEFISRYRRDNNNNHNNNNNHCQLNEEQTLPITSSHCPGWTLYAEKMLEEEIVHKISRVPSSQVTQGLLVKILCHTLNYLKSKEYLNYIKTFKYRSQITSNNIYDGNNNNKDNNSNNYNNKDNNNNNNNNKKDKVYHICVVPCYDKKFEMIRNEYKFDKRSYFPFLKRDNDQKEEELGQESQKKLKQYFQKKLEEEEEERLVDDILSTEDVDNILKEMKTGFRELKEVEIDQLEDYTDHFRKFASLSLTDSEGFTSKYEMGVKLNKEDRLNYLIKCSQLYCQSGGFAEEIFRQACLTLFGREMEKVVFKQTINSDFKECVLTDESNNVLLRFAISYGFNNIQNSIKFLKQSSFNNNNNNNSNDNNNNNNYNSNNSGNADNNNNSNDNNYDNNNSNNSNNNNSNNNNTNNDNNNTVNNINHHKHNKDNKDGKNNNKLVKRDNKLKFDYLEIMSCPGGCFNGAGQKISREGEELTELGSLCNKALKYIPETISNILKLNKKRINMRETSKTAFETFLGEATYVTTDHPVCVYFSEFINALNNSHLLQLNLNPLKNSKPSLKW